MPLRVLVADPLAESLFSALTARGVHVDIRPDLTRDTLPTAIKGAKVLVVRSTEVTKATIEAADQLSLIVRAGSGTNTIDVAAASAHGIYVSNTPGKNSVAVAELAIGMMVALDRRIPDNVADLRAGQWNKGLYSKAQGLKGSRLGLVGFGAIAREVAVRARAFGMKVSALSRGLSAEAAAEAGVARADSLEQLFTTSDIVSLHLPLSKETRGLVSRALLESMPKGAMLVNTARAEIVDHVALTELAAAGRIRVATDVFAREPEGKAGTFEDPLGKLPNVYGTHHIGASTEQAQAEIAAATVHVVQHFLETGEVENAVNLLKTPPVAGTLVVRHLDRVGVLASVLGTLRNENVNVETMKNEIFAGGIAACATILLAQRPSDETVAHLRALENVLAVELI
ncbi:NAD(P)-binding domain-containing protein [Myxococcota bacterium]|nr:NAD(P)-binding domain-containing protein [Myxococcota bacterium]